MDYTKENIKTLTEWYDNRPPELIAELNHPSGYTFYVAVDNTALPAYFNQTLHFGKGGTRCSKHLTQDKMSDLAKRMSKKNALPGDNGLYGGAKSGIKPPEDKPNETPPKHVIKDFANATWKFHVKNNNGSWGGPGCDINFQEDAIKHYLDSLFELNLTDNIHVATGRPNNQQYQGAAYDENGAAGKGVAKATDTALNIIQKHPEHFPNQTSTTDNTQKTVAIQGLGAMGSAVLKRLDQLNYKIIAVSDLNLNGTIINKDGLDAETILNAHENQAPDTLTGKQKQIEDILYVNCDILIPAAISDVITEENANDIQAKLIIEAANGPVTTDAHKTLYENNTLVIPGESANFGGSVAASVELDPNITNNIVQTSLERTDEFITNHIQELLTKFIDLGGFQNGLPPHYITNGIAIERIATAMKHRGDQLPPEIETIITNN